MSLPRDQRPAAIEAALRAALAPIRLDLVDESHKHAGHAGARDGRSHFDLLIISEAFRGLAPLARHRRVYAALGDLMATDVHALAIRAYAPGEPGA
jgi:BolA protein